MKESVRLEKRLRTVKIINYIVFCVGELLMLPGLIISWVTLFVDIPSDITMLFYSLMLISLIFLVVSGFLSLSVEEKIEKLIFNAKAYEFELDRADSVRQGERYGQTEK